MAVGFGGSGPELAISGEGIPAFIPIVRQIVEAAPDIPNWTVLAFRPRCGSVESVLHDGKRFSAKDIDFYGEIEDEKVNVAFYIRGLTKRTREQHIGAIFLLLDALIGEYETMTKLGAIDFLPFPPADPSTPLRPFGELRDIVDSLPSV